MKRLINPITVTILLVAIALTQSVLIGISFNKIHKLESAKSAAQNQEQQDKSAVSMAALNAASFNQPAVSVSDNKVYFPDIHLALPLNNDTVSFLYTGRQVGNPNKQTITTYDVTTRGLASLSPVGFQQRLACDPVRLAFEDKANPFSPHEKNNSSVKLADGRTLQIYAYSDSTCNAQWQAANVDPILIKSTFEQATSY
ncbi:MAG: hypothetical protein JWL85_1049 [Candidatus Saccharibacteria bacterium]|nr:hypothetical protein [Candidatus Saccharibacteria bacterium]